VRAFLAVIAVPHFVWALLVTCAPAHAGCLVEEQISKVRFAAINRGAELATQLQPILTEFRQINNKAKDPTQPVGPQLSTHDLARFGELRQRMMAIQIQQLLESNYARDYEVVGNLFDLMQRLYTGANEPKQEDADYKLYQIILLGRYAAETDEFKGANDISVPPKTEFEQCTLVAALHLVEDESMIKLNQLPTKDASRKFSDLRARYPSDSGTIDRKK